MELTRNRSRCRMTLPALALLAACQGWGAEINWHGTIDEARAAANQSGRPVYLYIFSAPQRACKRMRAETLAHPDVGVFLNAHFEACPIDSALTVNKAIVERYAWSVAVAQDEDAKVRFGSMPAHVFTNAAGEPYYTFWGYTPPAGFLVKLEQARRIVELKNAITAAPNDARLRADLGHILLEIEDFADAKLHLQKAKELDPENKVGALADATLDLIVLSIAEKPQEAHAQLLQFVRSYPQSARRLEAIYWQAVALYVQETPAAYRQALAALEPFRKLSVDDPQYRSRWAIEADKLEQNLRALLQGQ